MDSQVAGIGGDILGYNMFAYCFNNPVNMDDPTGNWPQIIRNLSAKLAHSLKVFGMIIISPLKSMSASLGAGIGIGISGKATVNGVPVEVSAVASVKDSINYDKGRIDKLNTSSVSTGVTIGNTFDFSYTEGKQHSYQDSDCNCTLMRTSFGEKMKCAANKLIKENNSTFGFSVSAYFLLGGELSIGIDLADWNERLIGIFEYNAAVCKENGWL